MGYGNTEQFLTPQQREALIRKLMGKTVDVVIDRPVGHTHVTKGITLHYSINYGFLPGVTGGDGEEQDVYVLGVAKPLSRFRGRIIEVIRRQDDNEDKLVAAPEGVAFTRQQIAEETYFVEKYFCSTVESLFEEGENA
ncbi:MAG: inorganic pyrophosphatase [Oscillospiraceae bacterium]|nr:inorganic pyrophosphatase [Oscillospiraceae bacterium]